jgi:S-sulfosulfanyl-L-cysteine sulfohydrolase
VLTEVIDPDPEITALILEARAPYRDKLDKVLGRTDSLLYRRGNFNGTFDDLICQALLAERDAEIALSPGFRWGSSLLPDQEITGDDLYNQTAITYPAAYRSEMTGAYLKEVLEDVADNLFNPDPYYQQGGDMVRAGGLAYTLTVDKPAGQRISDMVLLRTGEAIDSARKYVVGGWASVNEASEGPPIYDVVAKYIERMQRIRLEPNRHVKLVVSDPAGLDQADALSGARK